MLGSDRPVFKVRPTDPGKPLPLTAEQAQAVRKFVAQVGGFESAQRALDLLALLGKAA